MTIRGPAAAILLTLLFVSLGLNFLGVGFFAARVSGGGGGQTADLARIVEIGLQTFPPDIRRSIGRDLVENRQAVRMAVEEFREAQARLYRIMQATPLDEGALEAAFVEVRARTAALQSMGQATLARAIAGAPPEARAQIHPPRPLAFIP